MGRGRILIVEDHGVIARDVQWELENLGYQVVGIEAFGETAVREAERLKPDLVIMDIVLRGEMDGIEAAGAIGSRLRIPVVYLTAHSDQSSLERIKASQPFGYLTKPFSSSELHGTIETALYKHRMEQRLRESERRLELALAGAELALWDWNVVTGEVVRDQRWTEILGYPTPEPRGRIETWENLIHPQDKPGVLKALRDHLQSRTEAFEAEYRLRTSSGTWKWVLDRGKVIERDLDGKPMRIVGTFLDVTDRKAAQDALRESEKRYRTLFDSAVDGIFVHDLEGNFLDANLAGLSRLGYTREEILTMTPAELDTPEHAKLVPERMRQVLEQGFGSFETDHRCKDGTVVHLEFTARLIDYGGKQAILAIARDISERKRAEDRLRESEEKYRLVVDNASEGIAVIQDAMLKFVNNRAMEITGYSEKELTSRPFLEIVHPDDAPMVMARYKSRVRGERGSESTRFRILNSAGHIRWLEISAVSIGWGGRPATLYFLEDVTAKRKLERELLRVQKLESIGVLAGGIAHDFNNILTAILGNISLAKFSMDSPDKALGRLNLAENACARARVLTRQLLTFSKGGEPVKKVISLRGLVTESCLFGLRGSNVRCEFSLPEDLWNVEADEGQLSQVFNNLAINAGQAMPEGGTIRVEGRNVEVALDQGLPLAVGKYARITMIDTGTGISETDSARIFDPYFSTKPGGTGLGLAIAYSVLKNHEGLITVESEPGKGTAFHVFLPATDKTIADRERSTRQPTSGSARVLLMDDDVAVRDLAVEVLSFLGYEVVVAENGREALELYEQAGQSSRPFEVIILDLTVPGEMGGLEVIRTIRKTDRKVKAIVSSGYSNDPVMSDYQAYGFNGIVAKPYTVAELGLALEKVLSKRGL